MPKISALTSLAQASVDTAADVLPIVDATAPATTKKVTVQAVVNAGLAAAAPQGGTLALTGSLTVSGTVGLAAGTAAAPSVKVGSGNDGLFATTPGILGLAASGRLALRLETVASSVNYLYGYANATGATPMLRSVGSDTNVGLSVGTQGSGSFTVLTGGGAVTQFAVVHVTSAVNFPQVRGGAAGVPAQLEATGSDATVGIAYSTKSNANHRFFTGGSFVDEALRVAATSGAVNYSEVRGAVTSGQPSIRAAGSDTNAGFNVVSKGAGSVGLLTNNGSNAAMFAINVASSVNWVQVAGSATGDAVTYGTDGSDSNIDIRITPKGTGVLRFGSHSALAAETVTGYITIKDSGGTTRKLAVVS